MIVRTSRRANRENGLLKIRRRGEGTRTEAARR
jgi:hypothetical protein